MTGSQIDLGAVRGDAVDSGVEEGGVLIDYTNAVMARDAEGITRTRDAIVETLGSSAVADSAAVIAIFNVVDRVADATGIPIDDGFTRDMRYAIGEELGMQHMTPEERASR